jgi:hypothetical protein
MLPPCPCLSGECVYLPLGRKEGPVPCPCAVDLTALHFSFWGVKEILNIEQMCKYVSVARATESVTKEMLPSTRGANESHLEVFSATKSTYIDIY